MTTNNPLILAQGLPTAKSSEEVSGEADRSWLDRIGIGASLACAVHCLVAPFLLLLLPAAGSIWAHPAVHWVLAVLVLPLAVWVIYRGYLKHRNRWALSAAGLGSVCIVAGLIAPMIHDRPLFHATLPGFGSGGSMVLLADAQGAPFAEETAACTDPACCPSLAEDAATGGYTLAVPPGGLITLIGSLLLVFAHTSNLLACRCYRNENLAAGCDDSDCGCPA